MICPKCKNKVERGAGYCPNCGTQLKNDGKSKNEDQIEKSSKKKKIVILGSLMAVIVIAAIGFLVIVSKNNNQNEKLTNGITKISAKKTDTEYMQVADQVVDAIVTGNIKKFWDTLPEEYLGKYGEELENVTKSVIEDVFSDAASEFRGMEIDHKPVRSKKTSEDTLNRLKNEYEEEGYSVTSARIVIVELSVKGSQDELEVPVVEINGTWYLDLKSWGEDSIEDKIEDQEVDSSSSLKGTNFFDSRKFQDGLAFVRISGKGKSYKGFLNKNGKLIFYIPFDEDETDADIYRYDVNFENGYNWFEYDGIFYVIDTEGNIKSQYDAESVTDYGGGYTWLEEEENVSWDDAGFWRYTLYSPEGQEVCNYTISNTYLKSGNWSFGRKYIGDGNFLYEKMDEEKGESICILCEAKTKKITELSVGYQNAKKYGMQDGIIATIGKKYEYGHWDEYNPEFLILIGNGQEKRFEIPEEYQSGLTLLDWSKKYALFTERKDDQDIYFVFNLETQEIKQYAGKYAQYFKYYSTTTSCVEDNILALSMIGSDGFYYVCLINADTMEEIADPIYGEYFSMEDNVLLIDHMDMYDLNGNLLFTVDEDKKGEEISDRTLQVSYTEREEETMYGESEYVEVDKADYFDLKGKKLFSYSDIDISNSKMIVMQTTEE